MALMLFSTTAIPQSRRFSFITGYIPVINSDLSKVAKTEKDTAFQYVSS